MATASSSRASIAKTTPDAALAQAQSGAAVAPLTRREFLYYIWGASMALMTGQFVAATLWLSFPRFKEGEFGGIFPYSPADLPSAGSAPVFVASGRFHVSNTLKGLLVLYGVCTHLGCLPKWAATNERFECPCHGSKYRANGTWIEGPAPRGLDHFPIKVIYTDGTEAINDGLKPIALAEGKEIARIEVDTGKKVTGPDHGIIDL
jgi:cytochrome b6-f complex iron-sulfur subunit